MIPEWINDNMTMNYLDFMIYRLFYNSSTWLSHWYLVHDDYKEVLLIGKIIFVNLKEMSFKALNGNKTKALFSVILPSLIATLEKLRLFSAAIITFYQRHVHKSIKKAFFSTKIIKDFFDK